MGDQFHFDPRTYLELVRAEVPAYDELQDVVAATTGTDAARILELGIGTGETARRVLGRHPDASLVAIDESADMLAAAAAVVPDAELRLSRLEDPLPPGPFDLVVTALAIHHLDGSGKAALFRRVADVLAPGGRFVMGDVVVPDDPADAVTPIDDEVDTPSTVAAQLAWLGGAGLRPQVVWSDRDLVVVFADREG